MRRFIGAVLAALVLTAPAFVAPAWAGRLYGEESFTLKNGLQVVVVPNHRAPTVTQWLWYKAGAADEERGRSGAAHFLEHLMFKGTKTLKPKEFSREIAAQGGEENAFTSWDYTAFYQIVAADRLELVMKLEADRMRNLVITDAELEPERDVVLEEWRMRIGNQPSGLLEQQVQAALYLNHPYRIPVLGWTDEIKKLDVATEKRFYDTWYAPNNAILIIGGDVTVEQVRKLAQTYYGPIPAHPVPVRQRLTEPERAADTTVVLKSPRVRQPVWTRHVLAPSYRAGDTQYVYALQVLAEILGGGATGRLHRALVLDQQLATSAGAWYEGSRYDLGRFSFYVSARPDVDIEKAGAAAQAVVTDLLTNGVTEDEVARAKTRMITAEAYSRDSLTDPVSIIGRALATGRTLDDVDQWPDRIGAVTADQVMAAAHAVLDGKASVTSELLPGEGTAAAALPAGPSTSGDIR